MRRAFNLLVVVALLGGLVPSLLIMSTRARADELSAANSRYFAETGFSISNDAFWDYFQKRGALRTFGYPTSRVFTLMGKQVQFFQRRVMELRPDGSVGQINLLDPDVLPYTTINYATLPAFDAAVADKAPASGSGNYAQAALSFVSVNAPNTWNSLPVNFFRTFNDTVKLAEAFPNGGGNAGLLSGINFEMWGLPTSAPAADPNNGNFVYLRWQRGIEHFDKTTGLTQGLLLGDAFKQVITGQGLPGDLDQQARSSRYYKQYNNSLPNGLTRPGDLPSTNMKDAFEKQTDSGAPGAPPTPAPTATVPAQLPAGTSMRYGVQAHTFGVDRGQIYRGTRDLGFGWLKQQIEWKNFEGSPGAVNWDDLDLIVNEAAANRVSVMFSVVGAPPWAREPGFDAGVAGPPQDPQTFARYLGQMAGRYCGKGLGAIEVWNEQNLHYEWGNKTLSPADYMALLKPAYSAIKSACSSMIVVAGALTPTGAPAPLAMDDFTYLDGMYKNGLKDYSDAVGMHPSGYNVPPSLEFNQACDYLKQTNSSFMGPCNSPHHSWSFRSTVNGYYNIMVQNGDPNKQLWATEFGWAAGGAYDPNYAYANDNTFDEQAAWTVEAYQYMRASGFVGAAFLWNLNFRVVADRTEKAQWGIVDNRWAPLPAYNALKSMAK